MPFQTHSTADSLALRAERQSASLARLASEVGTGLVESLLIIRAGFQDTEVVEPDFDPAPRAKLLGTH